MSDNSLSDIIASNLRLYRKLHGMTQAELGECLLYSDKSISKWERGEGLPDVAVLLSLSELYGVTVSELIGQTPKSKATKERIKAAEKDKKAVDRAKKRAADRAKKQRKKHG